MNSNQYNTKDGISTLSKYYIQDGKDKEKVFMLEQQNKALAKQYFTSQEENKQLKIENERHCNQIQELQGDCDSYQIVIQNLYSRIMDIINKSLTKLVDYYKCL